MRRIKIGNVRTPVDYLKQFFAPAGYGLGSFGVSTSDLDTNTKSGCYSFTDGCKNAPCSYGVALVLNRYDVDIVQIVFNVSMKSGYEGGSIARRVYVEAEWSEWEYFNPPTQPGVEYRTTERWMGKTVYTKLINCQTLTTGRTPIYIGDITNIIRYAGSCDYCALPYRDPNINGTIDMAVEPGYIIFNVNVPDAERLAALGTAYVQIWYTKD